MNATLEKEALKKLSSSIYSYDFNKDDSELIVNINDKVLGLIKIYILLVENYPFEIPLVKIEFQVLFLISQNIE